MSRTAKKREPYKRRLHQPLFDIPDKTTTKLGRTVYQKLYMRQLRANENKLKVKL